MIKKNNRIMGIDPGSSLMGVCVMEGDELIYYAVRSLKKFRPKHQLQKSLAKILNQIIVEYNVKTLVLEKGWFSQEASPLFMVTYNTIIRIAKKNKLIIEEISPLTVRKILCKDSKATKERTARKLADIYPELEIYLDQKYLWRQKYWFNMFDSVATVVAYKQQLQNVK